MLLQYGALLKRLSEMNVKSIPQCVALTSENPTIELLTEGQAAAVLGLKKATLQQRRWQKQKGPLLVIVIVKIGRFVRYRMEDIAAYLDSCVVHPAVDK